MSERINIRKCMYDFYLLVLLKYRNLEIPNKNNYKQLKCN